MHIHVVDQTGLNLNFCFISVLSDIFRLFKCLLRYLLNIDLYLFEFSCVFDQYFPQKSKKSDGRKFSESKKLTIYNFNSIWDLSVDRYPSISI